VGEADIVSAVNPRDIHMTTCRTSVATAESIRPLDDEIQPILSNPDFDRTHVIMVFDLPGLKDCWSEPLEIALTFITDLHDALSSITDEHVNEYRQKLINGIANGRTPVVRYSVTENQARIQFSLVIWEPDASDN
jgi:hypothetical protein